MDNVARTILNRVNHKIFQRGISKFFVINPDGTKSLSSLCWLYCWCKTGLNSEKVRRQAIEAFNALFKKSFSYYDKLIDHEKARKGRYIDHNNSESYCY